VPPTSKTGFVRALLDSAIPRDLHSSTVGIVKGDYVVERKTLLHHATTSDQYDLFAPHRRAAYARSERTVPSASSSQSSQRRAPGATNNFSPSSTVPEVPRSPHDTPLTSNRRLADFPAPDERLD
jgi:hypothetical protein